MVEPVRQRQTKEAGTDMLEPKATAPHLDSTATNDSIGPASPETGPFCWPVAVSLNAMICARSP
jgi:hypothetical protein